MTAIVRLKVTLEDVEPEVMRRLDVPLKIRLDRLHLVLQAAMELDRRPSLRVHGG